MSILKLKDGETILNDIKGMHKCMDVLVTVVQPIELEREPYESEV
jgi:hypothetical protein